MYQSITLCSMNKSIKNDFVFNSSDIFTTSNRIVCMRKDFFFYLENWRNQKLELPKFNDPKSKDFAENQKFTLETNFPNSIRVHFCTSPKNIRYDETFSQNYLLTS